MRKATGRAAGWVVLCFAAALAAFAAPAAAERRVALMIGNAGYAEAPLANPVNDATAMAAALGELGFEVFRVLDGDLRAMQEAVLGFTAAIRPGDAALIFYAGHGIQANGRNYLIPVEGEGEGELSATLTRLD